MEVTDDIKNSIFSRQLGKKAYELKDHLGNVRTTFSDIKMPTGSGSQPFRVDLLSKSEYARIFCLFFFCFADRYSRRKCFAFTPNGMKINDLSYNATDARYGYNSQEQSTELNLDGNHTTAEFWEYDARSTRRWNLDPRPVVGISSYATFQSNPIMFSDPFGDSIFTNKYGDITRNDETDKMVFLQDGKSLQKIGDLGDKIDITGILPNVLERNSNDAKELDIPGYGNKVMTGKDWDYKNDKETIFGLAWAYDKKNNQKSYFWDKKYTVFTWKDHYTFDNAAAVGNYHAGYIGSFPFGGAGINEKLLILGAGVAEFKKNTESVFLRGELLELPNFLLSSSTFRLALTQVTAETVLFLYCPNATSHKWLLTNPIIGPAGDRYEDNYWNKQGMKDATNAKKRK